MKSRGPGKKTLPLFADALQPAKFREWVIAQGFHPEETNSEWEVIRYRTEAGVEIVYRNKLGRLNWQGYSNTHYLMFLRGENLIAGTSRMKSSARADAAQRIIARDGPDSLCFYCWSPMKTLCDPNDPKARTVEHLVPRSVGGTSALWNLVFACYDCNTKVGSMPLVDKIKLHINNHPTIKAVVAASQGA